MAIPIYIIDQSTMSQLSLTVQPAGFQLQKTGIPQVNTEGIEQVWKCCDAVGDLFFFETVELNDENGLRLKAGTLCLIAGPGALGRKRKETSAAYRDFEHALLALGAKKFK